MEGKWRLEEPLGRGGMGTVYRARELALDRVVAIKILSGSAAQDQEVVVRFEREALMMAKLDHPNLVPILAVGRRKALPFIVMKYLEGTNLAQHLHRKGPLPMDEVLSITRQVCDGLEFIHSSGFIHRDIKPGNIFIGPNGRVTILDLGVAHDPGSQLTKSGVLIGTPKYMSPEQVLGVSQLDHRSDLYAVGLVLYEMLSGQPVFESENHFSLMKAHKDLAPPDPALRFGLPEPVSQVIKKSLAKSPADRYQSANALFAALEQAAKAVPVEPATSVTESAAPTQPPSPVETLIEAPSVDRTRLDRPSQDKAEAVRAARQRRRLLPPLIAALVLFVIAGVIWAFKPRAPKPSPAPVAAPPALAAPPPTPAPVVAPSAPVPPVVVESAPFVEPTPEPVEPAAAKRSSKSSRAKPVELKPAPGELAVSVTIDGKSSWAYVEVNGARPPKPDAPVLLKPLKPGKHRIRLSRPGFQTTVREVTIEPGQAQSLVVELKPQ